MAGMHDHPFYRPLWRRIAIVAVAASWALFEFLFTNDGFWTAIAVGMTAYSAWAFLISWKDPPAA